MDFKLSSYAQKQLADRGIPFFLLEFVLNQPQQIYEEDVVQVYQSQFDRSGKVQLLRGYVNASVEPAVVVTIYVTSKIEKYWRTE
ncbi:MAG: DUF4258 domain-containing protein [Thermosynechococcaceae cyanobacterium MS004]|nr:DUF4258 domain-containing protein [Thermosynechococcaceae cyanobacterium MS004]